MLYFAYGSNLHVAGLRARCPGAERLGRAVLPDHRLVFRRWADVEPRPGDEVAGGLWRVTAACEAMLDDYEDVAGGLYRRILLPVRPEGAAAPVVALVYRMTATLTAPPEPDYLAIVLEGHRDFGLAEAPVRAAAMAAMR